MYILRPVKLQDIDDLVDLAIFLDTVNFPNDRCQIEKGIHQSIASFNNKEKDSEERIFQFVLEDPERHRVLGVSKIIAHHGTPEKPHFYWEISYDIRESKTIGIGVKHQVLELGKDTQGHTEIAGIIIHPDEQGKQLGKQLFYVRFLYMALNRKRFLDRIISELLPPLDKNNKSPLWEAYGRKFTGLTYQEADKLSHDNKEFISALFPQNRIYTTLLPAEARNVIGIVGEKSKPVKHLAEKNGLKFLNQIDPFDGGPHFGCRTDEVIALKNVKTLPAEISPSGDELGLVCKTKSSDGNFLAVQAKCSVNDYALGCPPEAMSVLNLQPGEEITFLPYT